MTAEAHDAMLISPARTAAASALRRLGHAIVGHQVDDDVFERITAAIERVVPEIESGEPRSRPVDDMKRRLFETPRRRTASRWTTSPTAW